MFSEEQETTVIGRSYRRLAMGAGVVAAVLAAVVAVVLLSGDDAPSKDDPAAYTRFVVERTIDRYDRDGREATLEFVSSAESVDGQWYPFIIDQDGYTIAHHNPELIGRDPSKRVDSTGYFYGDDMLAATDEGHWVSYVFVNPETGQEQRKHTWVVRHDGLLFGSGWYKTNEA